MAMCSWTRVVDLPVVVQVQVWSRQCTVRAVLGQGR